MSDVRKSLLNNDGMPKSITLNKLNGFKLFSLDTRYEQLSMCKTKLKYLTNDPSQYKLMIGLKILLLWDEFGIVSNPIL